MACLGYSTGPSHELFAPSPWNPEGYIQRPDVTLFNTRVIEDTGGTITKPRSPEQIANSALKDIRCTINLEWTRGLSRVLIKDPRFCATGLYWIMRGIPDGFDIELLHISRDIESTARSCLSHYDVKEYVDSSLHQAHETVKLYDDYAAWLLRNVPQRSLHVKYEDLLLEPLAAVRRLASFAECGDEGAVKSALAATKAGHSLIPTEGELPP